VNAEWDYWPWGEVFDHGSMTEFESCDRLADGVHRIPLERGRPLELLVKGRPLDRDPEGRAVPLFLSGALGNRSGSKGPYFSGRQMAMRSGTGFLAFSDPLLREDPGVGLAWYTGMPGSGTRELMLRVVAHLMEIAERPVLLVGGSGGGFASLSIAAALPNARAFVWNPQVRILDYEPNAVRLYLRAMFGGDWTSPDWKDQAAAELTAGGIIHDLTALPQLGQFLLLQNYSDWHVRTHTAPLIDSLGLAHRGRGYFGTRKQGLLFGNFGSGHSVPPGELLDEVLALMRSADGDAWGTFHSLSQGEWLRGYEPTDVPLDLQAMAADVISGLELKVRELGGGITAVVARTIPATRTGRLEFQFFAYSEGGRLGQSLLSTDPVWVWRGELPHRLVCVIRDGLGHILGQTVWSHDTTAETPNIFIFGSCVSRDAFEFDGSPPMHTYLARSSVGSAMSGVPTGLEQVDLSGNPSAFQRRMVAADLNRSLAKELQTGGYSHLLVDLIDERFALGKAGAGALFSISPELVRAGVDLDGIERVASGSPEHLAAFREGWSRLAEAVPPARIIVNRVYWAVVDSNGDPLAGAASIEQANRTLDTMYALIEEITPGVHWITYEPSLFAADAGHKWGLSPFHFTEDLYRRTLEVLAQITAGPDDTEAQFLVLCETMFCDYEPDPEVRGAYLDRWLHALRQQVLLDVPRKARFVGLLYVSEDKDAELLALGGFLDSLSPQLRDRFRIVTYRHPEGGYGLGGATHVDLVKMPNKHAPRRDQLFQRALDQIDVGSATHIIRTALDDDDFWLPWQLSEIVRLAGAVVDDSGIIGVGMTQCCVAYMQEGVVDHVDTTRCLTGNKFYVARVEQLPTLAKLSPWGVPEVFNENVAEAFARTGVRLMMTSSHRAGWVYGRWGRNLTVDHKDPYYVTRHQRIEFGDLAELPSALIRELSFPPLDEPPVFRVAPRSFEVWARRDQERLVITSNLDRFDVVEPSVEIHVWMGGSLMATHHTTGQGPWDVDAPGEGASVGVTVSQGGLARLRANSRGLV